jgi:hypothetical protein
MVWASLEGIPLPIFRGSWSRSDNPQGVESRTISGAFVQTRFAEGEVFRGRSTALNKEQRESFRGLIKGWGETWRFDTGSVAGSSSYSTKGSGWSAAPTITTGSGGKFTGTGLLTVASAGTIRALATYSKRFWISLWRFETAAVDGAGITVGVDGWHRYDVMGFSRANTIDATGDLYTLDQTDFARGVTTLKRASVWRDGVAGTYKAGFWLDFNNAGTGLQLSGKSSSNVNANKDYSMIAVRPFWGQSTWPAIGAARVIADAGLERLNLEGDDLQSGEVRVVTGGAVDVDTVDGFVDGVFGRRLDFTLSDAVDASP